MTFSISPLKNSVIAENNGQMIINDILPNLSAWVDEQQLLELYNYATEEKHSSLIADMTKGEAVFKENFKGKSYTDDEWVKIMVDNPKLIERPIIVDGEKAVLGRPPENVLTLL